MIAGRDGEKTAIGTGIGRRGVGEKEKETIGAAEMRVAGKRDAGGMAWHGREALKAHGAFTIPIPAIIHTSAVATRPRLHSSPFSPLLSLSGHTAPYAVSIVFRLSSSASASRASAGRKGNPTAAESAEGKGREGHRMIALLN
jgi:hypothetical protein